MAGVLLCKDAEGSDHLLHIRRADHEKVRHGTKLRQNLDRLVRGAVLSEVDRVVRADVKHRELRDRGHSERGHAVLEKDGEERRVRNQRRIGADAIENGKARVLAHAEVDVAPGIAGTRPQGRRQEIALDARKVGPDAAGDVGRSSDQRRSLLGKILEHLGDVDTAGFVLEALRADLETLGRRLVPLGGIVLVPQVGQRGHDGGELVGQVFLRCGFPAVGHVLPLESLLQVFHDGWLLLSEGLTEAPTKILPGLAEAVALLSVAAEALEDRPRHVELRKDPGLGC
mmetsp:Transcript_5741/g.13569  ORF Transcript_5741/g.13569 Transcript_5741/m.13569 type:complete len:285 (+) Transcript_5741:737-1591(+)